MTCQINQEVRKSSTEAVVGAPHDPLNAQAHTLIDVQCPTIYKIKEIKGLNICIT